MNGEFGFPLFVRELASVPGRMWQMKEPFANALVEVFETGHDASDRLANVAVVSDHCVPVDRRPGAERCFREAGDDGGFTWQQLLGRLGVTLRAVDGAHAVFNGHELRTAGLKIKFRSAQAREDECRPPGNQMRAIKFRGNVRGQRAGLKRTRGDFGIRRR